MPTWAIQGQYDGYKKDPQTKTTKNPVGGRPDLDKRRRIFIVGYMNQKRLLASGQVMNGDRYRLSQQLHIH